MGAFWNLIGLPQPDPARQATQVNSSRARGTKESGRNATLPIETMSDDQRSYLRPSWAQHNGPRTPDGWPLHDLGDSRWTQLESPENERTIRHLSLWKKSPLEIEVLRPWLAQGDLILLDLTGMRQIDSLLDSARRDLIKFSEELSVPVYVIDDEQELLLIPGAGVVVDAQDHQLGAPLAPLSIDA